MLLPISDERRRLLLQIAACICGGTLTLLFLTGSPSFTARATTLAQTGSPAVPALPDRLSFPNVDIGHDPFIPRVTANAMVGGATNSPGGVGDGMGVVLPPNAGASGTPVAEVNSTALPIVRAVVVGDGERALVEQGGSVQVMAVGDALGASTIASIDSTGVTLASGTRLLLAREKP